MHFKELRLPETAIAELFKNSLVQDVDKHRHLAVTPPAEPGEPEKSKGPILIVVNYPGAGEIPVKQHNFLTNVLKACQLDIKEVTILNMAKQTIVFNDLRLLMPKCVLLFNIDQALLPLPLEPPPFAVTLIEGISVLSAPGLDSFTATSEQSRQSKTKLWAGLKQIFNI